MSSHRRDVFSTETPCRLFLLQQNKYNRKEQRERDCGNYHLPDRNGISRDPFSYRGQNLQKSTYLRIVVGGATYRSDRRTSGRNCTDHPSAAFASTLHH